MNKCRKVEKHRVHFEMAYHILWFADEAGSSNIVNSTLLNLKMCLDMNINYMVILF